MKTKHKYFFILLNLVMSIGLLTSCETTEPPLSNQKLTLTTEDTSCTEVWLNLKLENISLPTEISINQNDSLIITANINSSDTTLYIENLLPNKTYSFYSTIPSFQNSSAIKSNKVSVTTMDTTSHNITWETFTIGNRGTLRDVAIINENNIWAVGEIYVNDSLGQLEPTARGFAQWNGKEWKITRKEAIGPTGVKSNLRPNGIIAFAEKDIWFAHGGVFHWNGNEITPYWINKFPGNTSPILEDGQLISKLWGTSSSNLYAVGTNGALANFDGSSWRKIESGTEVDLLDVWGSKDGSVVWACGYDSDNSRTVLLRIENGDVKIIYEGDSYGENNGYGIGLFGGLYGKRDNLFLMNTGWVFKQRNEDRLNVRFVTDITTWGYSMDGNDVNDIFVSGQQGLVGHYNGYSYKEYEELKNNNDKYYSIAAKNKTIVTVGRRRLNEIQMFPNITIGKQ